MLCIGKDKEVAGAVFPPDHAIAGIPHCNQRRPPEKRKKGQFRGGRNRIGRREKWPKKSWEEGETGGKSREEGEKET